MISYFLQSMTSLFIFIFLRPYKWRLLLLIIIVSQNENGYYSVFRKNKLNHYRMIARPIVPPYIESASLKKKFYDLPGSTIFKLKELRKYSLEHCEVIRAMGCCPPSSTFGIERIFNRIRCVLACCGGKVIVQDSEFFINCLSIPTSASPSRNVLSARGLVTSSL